MRLYESRSLAIEACAAGHVKLGGQSLKPAREVHPGEGITALTGRHHRTVKVLALLDRRVGANLVKDYLEDLTPGLGRRRVNRSAIPEVWAGQRRSDAGSAATLPSAVRRARI